MKGSTRTAVITGGGGVNQLRNEGSVGVEADAAAAAVAAELTVSNLKDASGGSAALSKSTTQSHATAVGLDSGEGKNRVPSLVSVSAVFDKTTSGTDDRRLPARRRRRRTRRRRS